MARRRGRRKKEPVNPFAKSSDSKKKGQQQKASGRAPTGPKSYISDASTHVSPTPTPPPPPVAKPAVPEHFLKSQPESPPPQPQESEPEPAIDPPSAPTPPVEEQPEAEIEEPSTDVSTETENEISDSPSPEVSPEPVSTETETISEPPAKSETKAPAAPAGPASAAGKVRSIGLRKSETKTESPIKPTTEVKDYTKDLISQSKQSARESGMEVEDETTKEISAEELFKSISQEHLVTKKSTSDKQFEEKRRLAQKRKKARSEGDPVKRVIKLNRRKYMEFKVDLREIMDEEDVADEYRAGILGSTWAKGERQGIDSAIEFVEEKRDDGILCDAAADRIIKVLKGYRTKR